MKHDVIIVGAGPAGLMAARSLARSNIEFLVIDSKKEIGLPLKCGEGIRTGGFTELFGHTGYDFVKNRTNRVEVRCGRSKRVLRVEYLMLDRPAFEKWLAYPITRRIKLKTACRDIVRKKDCLELVTNKGVLRARLVILAHGCDYRIQKKFNLVKRPPLTIPCYGGVFKSHDADLDTLYFFFDDKDSTGLWLFPKDRHTANVGIGVYPRFQRSDIKRLFSQAIKRYGFKLKGRPTYGDVFPTSGPIDKTFADRLLVCGNAAGQVYAGSGEGIYFALKSGRLAGSVAARAVRKNDFSPSVLKHYERSWKRSFGNKLYASRVFCYLMFIGFRFRKLEKLFSLPKEKELVDLFMRGRLPIKARIAYYVARVYNLADKKKKRLPLTLRMLWRLSRILKG